MFMYDEASVKDEVKKYFTNEETGEQLDLCDAHTLDRIYSICEGMDDRIEHAIERIYAIESYKEVLMSAISSLKYDKSSYEDNTESDYRKTRYREAQRRLRAIVRDFDQKF